MSEGDYVDLKKKSTMYPLRYNRLLDWVLLTKEAAGYYNYKTSSGLEEENSSWNP